MGKLYPVINVDGLTHAVDVNLELVANSGTLGILL